MRLIVASFDNQESKSVAIEFVACPVCKQKLVVYDYMTDGADVVCVNCESNLRISQHNPIKLELIPLEETYNRNDRPESYD